MRYAPVKVRPSTLAADFIRDLLSVTGGGRARTFDDARDHAMIRVLTEGVRRAELVQICLDDLRADLIARPCIRVVPLKGARAADEGRIVPLTLAPARAIVVYLRVRQSHGRAQTSPALWLGTRNRGAMTGSGVYRMVKRRAEQAGYEPSVYPPMFRHTFAHDWLAGGGPEGDLMRLMGWQDRAMLDRYGADLQVQRAIEANDGAARCTDSDHDAQAPTKAAAAARARRTSARPASSGAALRPHASPTARTPGRR